MATCSHCGVETELHHNGVPICPKCSDEREHKAKRKPPGSVQPIRKLLLDEVAEARKILLEEIAEATLRVNKASEMFLEVTNKTISFPHPDGIQRMHNVSRELTKARQGLMKAHAALDDFLKTGIVAEDLKRSG